MPTISVIVCAYNEERYLGGCLHSIAAQTRPPDELVVVNNSSTDGTADVARRVATVNLVDEPRPGLVIARDRGRRATTGEVLAYLDADCRAPLQWLERVEREFVRGPHLVAVTGPYRYYDWDLWGRALVKTYDWTVAPATHVVAQRLLRMGAILYGGNFAVRREALERIGGFDASIEFHGEDTNLARRLSAVGSIRLSRACWLYTSARRYRAMGKRAVFRLYVRNFWSELIHHRPADDEHLDVRV
jgi:glycosyltransferase involved in cell wall biosynthesis